MDNMNLSVIKYIGKKDIKLIDKLNNLNITSYCEPFSGSFNVGLNLIEDGFTGDITLNDLSYNIYIFWVMLKNDYKSLYNNIHKHLSIINKIENKLEYLENIRKSDNDLDRASGEYLFRQFQTIKGIKINSNKINKDIFDFSINNCYLQNVKITNKDYRDIIKELDKDTCFMFVDPPYVYSKSVNYYDKQFMMHSELRDLLINSKSKWILTYNDCEYIRYLYRELKIEEVKHKGVCKCNELYISNF